ncbi:SMI1/KNR4 family protein [Marininema halotolerans]|uniref:SMI1 / KNR4 family (SUKH-1) n=1 Tax=Marininema halotolerans TaxID=1155944 RepID=A0A1I6PYN9_9BACL|nr:SMI1/KNR4 family protein [Marininema halotolerans]SFS45228.1 SMI1 / KNR4 family (SUKH-1) [Marininema halotolerans]
MTLTNTGSLKVQNGTGYLQEVTFEFKKPASEEEINKAQDTLGITLPSDLLEFYRISNGAYLFISDDGLDRITINSTQDIVDRLDDFPDWANDWIPIVSYYEHEFMMNRNAINNQKNNYLYARDLLGKVEDAMDLGRNFEIFLSRLITAQGDDYWKWPIYTAENFYRTHS